MDHSGLACVFSSRLSCDGRARATSRRRARTRHYVMCTPSHFAVEYAINPWMDPTVPVDADRATAQWDVSAH